MSTLVGASALNTLSHDDSRSAWTTQEEVVWRHADHRPRFAQRAGLIRESSGNGFVTRIDLLDDSDVWHTEVWTGTDATATDDVIDFVVTFTQSAYDVKGVKIFIEGDGSILPEIDAVKLLTSATSSSTAPDADDDTASTTEDVPVDIAVGANDTISGIALLSITVAPEHGYVCRAEFWSHWLPN